LAIERGGLTSTQKFILGVFGAMLVASVISVFALFALNNNQHAQGASTPNPNCQRLVLGATPANRQIATTQTYADSDFYGCQTVGMNEEAGTALLTSHNIAVRIATRDGISYPLTADYSEARVNLTITKSVITAYEVG